MRRKELHLDVKLAIPDDYDFDDDDEEVERHTLLPKRGQPRKQIVKKPRRSRAGKKKGHG